MSFFLSGSTLWLGGGEKINGILFYKRKYSLTTCRCLPALSHPASTGQFLSRRAHTRALTTTLISPWQSGPLVLIGPGQNAYAKKEQWNSPGLAESVVTFRDDDNEIYMRAPTVGYSSVLNL